MPLVFPKKSHIFLQNVQPCRPQSATFQGRNILQNGTAFENAAPYLIMVEQMRTNYVTMLLRMYQILERFRGEHET